MKVVKKLALASAIAAISSASFALEDMSEDALSTTTGQAGITVKVVTASAITTDLILHDTDGYAGFTGAGAIVIGDPVGPHVAGTHDSMSVLLGAGGMDMVIDASGDGDSGTAGNQPILRVGITLNGTTTIHTGDLSVAKSNGVGSAVSNQTADILNDMTITLGSASLVVSLGNEVATGGSMIAVNATITSGLNITGFALADANGGAGATINATAIDINNKGTGLAGDLTVVAAVNVVPAGLTVGITQLGLAGGAGTGGFDVAMTGLALGTSPAIGNIELKGLNLNGTTLTISGH